MTDNSPHIAKLIRDPEYVKNRIFIGNLPSCTREEVQSICNPYGRVLGAMVQKNFGFVQFESEEIANKAAFALNKSTFKSNILTVRNAASKKPTQLLNLGSQSLYPITHSSINALQRIPCATTQVNKQNECNDCEIIVVDKNNTKYAEYIEYRLKRINLRVDVLFPKSEVVLSKVLAEITIRGCLYAILVTPQHEEHNSITVNILHDQPAEHRNMPLEDAIKLITNDFNLNVNRCGIDELSKIRASLNFLSGREALNQVEKHPDNMQAIFHLLAENMPLNVSQYDDAIKYLTDRRSNQLRLEMASQFELKQPVIKQPDPEIIIQKKLLHILRKIPSDESKYDLLYPSLAACKQDNQLMELLKNERVRIALDTLIKSKLLKTVETAMNFSP